MYMAAATKLWTVDEVRALPHEDGVMHELIDGVLYVTPAPSWRHGELVMSLYDRLHAHVVKHAVAHVRVSPQDIIYGTRTMLQPDVFAVPLIDGRRPRSWDEAGWLLLAVEVLSPSDASCDRYVKRPRYQRERVPDIWLVDGESRLVERWRPDDRLPETLTERLEWRPYQEHPALVIDLPELFAEAFGE